MANERTNTAKWMENQKRWQVKVQKDGIRKTFTSSTPGRTGQREANAKADVWLGAGISSDRRRVAELYAEFIKSKEESTCKSNSQNIRSRYNLFVEPLIATKRISSLTEQDLQDIINKAYKDRGLSAKSLRNIKGDLMAFLKFCRMKKVTSMISENLTIPASAKRPDKKILQPKDIAKLFESEETLLRGKVCKEPYIHAFRVAVLTGLRPGEVIGLRWADVEPGKINVKRSINFQGEETQGKNKNAVRTIVLSQRAREELENQRAITGKMDSVFEIDTMGNYYKRWKKYTAYNEMSSISLYEMRHTFVSVAQNLPEGLVKKIVGHSKSMDTWGTYAHLLDGQQENTAQKLEDTFNEILKQ